MADIKFSQFDLGGEMQVGDIPVGLRTGQPTKNFQFDFPGMGIKDSSGNYLFQYATAGVLAQFTVTAKDESGVRRTSGGDDFVVELEGTRSVTGSVIDNLDGTYPVSYTVTKSG